MKKNLKICMCGLMAVMLVSGCSQKADTAADTTAATTEAAAADGASDEDFGTSDPITLNPGTVEKLGNYKGVAYTPLPTEVSDEEVEAEIKALIDANPVYEKVDRDAREGDAVSIDYVGLKDGVAFNGGTGSVEDLELGSGDFIPGFEDGLVGAREGQELSLNLTFPDDYGNTELAGQDVVFDVTVNGVLEVREAKLNDEFIAANTASATVEEYRKAVREDLEEYAKNTADSQKRTDVFLKVVDDSEVTVPEESIELMYTQQKLAYEQQAQMFGVDLETMVSYYGMDMETFESGLMTDSEAYCKQNAVALAIAEAENLTVEETDKEEMATYFGYESVDAMIEENGEDEVNNRILMDKAVNFVVEHAVEE